MRMSTFGGLLLVGLAGAILFAMPVMTARGRVGQAATPAEFVGCWRFNNGQLVRVVKDGTLSMGQLKGKWRLADPDKRVYVINWPEILDNAVLSADEKTLTETTRGSRSTRRACREARASSGSGSGLGRSS
jgi:hypothetical protein